MRILRPAVAGHRGVGLTVLAVAWLLALPSASLAATRTDCGQVGGASGRYDVTTLGVACPYARRTAFRRFLAARLGPGGVWGLAGFSMCVTTSSPSVRTFGTCVRPGGWVRWRRVE